MSKPKKDIIEASDNFQLTTSQITLLKQAKIDGYTLKNNIFLGSSYFALYKDNLPPIPVNRKTAESILGKGFFMEAGKNNNVISYKLTPKADRVNFKK